MKCGYGITYLQQQQHMHIGKVNAFSEEKNFMCCIPFIIWNDHRMNKRKGSNFFH